MNLITLLMGIGLLFITQNSLLGMEKAVDQTHEKIYTLQCPVPHCPRTSTCFLKQTAIHIIKIHIIEKHPNTISQKEFEEYVNKKLPDYTFHIKSEKRARKYLTIKSHIKKQGSRISYCLDNPATIKQLKRELLNSKKVKAMEALLRKDLTKTDEKASTEDERE